MRSVSSVPDSHASSAAGETLVILGSHGRTGSSSGTSRLPLGALRARGGSGLDRAAGAGGGGIKEGGYGVPHRIRWQSAAGPRTLVLETVRPGGFGHEDRSDRAGILLRAYEDYATLPRHVRAVDVGAFRKGGPAISLGEAARSSC